MSKGCQIPHQGDTLSACVEIPFDCIRAIFGKPVMARVLLIWYSSGIKIYRDQCGKNQSPHCGVIVFGVREPANSPQVGQTLALQPYWGDKGRLTCLWLVPAVTVDSITFVFPRTKYRISSGSLIITPSVTGNRIFSRNEGRRRASCCVPRQPPEALDRRRELTVISVLIVQPTLALQNKRFPTAIISLSDNGILGSLSISITLSRIRIFHESCGIDALYLRVSLPAVLFNVSHPLGITFSGRDKI